MRPAADEPEGSATETASGKSSAKPSRDIKIEQIRALTAFVETASHRGGEKVVLIMPADAMNQPASNALLKTLEEPSPGTRFILVTDKPERLSATVRSRCRHVPLNKPAPEVARAWGSKATGGDAKRVEAWLAYCGGAPLRAVEFAKGEYSAALSGLLETLARLPGDALESAQQ